MDIETDFGALAERQISSATTALRSVDFKTCRLHDSLEIRQFQDQNLPSSDGCP
jgi:hypothetical protein